MASVIERFVRAVAERIQQGYALATGRSTNDWFEVFERLPRETRIEILGSFTADEIDDVLCRVNRKYKRIFCGDMVLADMTLPGGIPESEVLYEHWLRLLENDFGVSSNPDLCRGHTPLERDLVSKALKRAIPTQNRLNSYLSQAYGSMYQAMRKITERLSGLVGVERFLLMKDHIAFLQCNDPELGRYIIMSTSVDLVYAQITNKKPFGTVLYLGGTNPLMGSFAVMPCAAHGGIYCIYVGGAEISLIVHFYKDAVNVSVPITNAFEFFNLELFADPFEPAHAYVLLMNNEDVPGLNYYRMISTEQSNDGALVLADRPIEKIRTFASLPLAGERVLPAKIELDFKSFSLSWAPTEVAIRQRQGSNVAISLGAVTRDSSSADEIPKLYIVPLQRLTRLASNTMPSLRIVIIENLLESLSILSIKCKPQTAEPLQATRYTLQRVWPRPVSMVFQIENGNVLRIQFRELFVGYASASTTLNLDTGSLQIGNSSTKYTIKEGVLSEKEKLIPISVSLNSWPLDLQSLEQVDTESLPLRLL